MNAFEELTPQKEVYRTADGVSLNLYLFRPLERSTSPTPAVVFFFGGGWVGGSPEQFFAQCRYLASRGMVAVSAEYRVRSRHGTTPFESVADGKSAVRWLREQADRLGLDPDRLAAGGGSAGGHVAAATAMIPDGRVESDRALRDADNGGRMDDGSAMPDALVLFNPALDTKDSRLAERFAGRGVELSPLHHVRPGLPPTIIFHGTADATVPYEEAEAFTAAMRKAANSCELIGFEGYGHGFFNHGRDENRPFVATMRATDRFLVEHGFLFGEATL